MLPGTGRILAINLPSPGACRTCDTGTIHAQKYIRELRRTDRIRTTRLLVERKLLPGAGCVLAVDNAAPLPKRLPYVRTVHTQEHIWKLHGADRISAA